MLIKCVNYTPETTATEYHGCTGPITIIIIIINHSYPVISYVFPTFKVTHIYQQAAGLRTNTVHLRAVNVFQWL